MIQILINRENISYDERHDVLHVFFAPSEPSVDDEDFPGIVIRRSINDNRITGFMIMDYTKRGFEILKYLLPQYGFPKIDVVGEGGP